MIDTIKMRKAIRLPYEAEYRIAKPITRYGLEFKPDISIHKGEKFAKSHTAKLGNLRLRFKGRHLYISNSIHKYYDQNNWNYSDFNRSRVKKAFEQLGHALGLDLSTFQIRSISYGVNLQLDSIPYEDWLFYKEKRFIPMMTRGGKQYGVEFRFNDYKIKIYDKTLEVKLHQKQDIDQKLFRFEIEVFNVKRNLLDRSKPIPIAYVDQIWNPINFNLLQQDLIEKYLNIQQKINWGDDLTLGEINAITAMESSWAAKPLKENNNRTYRRYRGIYNKKMKSMRGEHNQKFERKLRAKLEQLKR